MLRGVSVHNGKLYYFDLKLQKITISKGEMFSISEIGGYDYD